MPMATYTNGLFGLFKGSVGNVVGSNYRGKPIMRIKGQTSTKPPSQAQLLQRLKFSVMMPFLNPLKPLLLQTFKNHPTDRAGFDAAKSYVMTEVLQPVGDTVVINYSKMLISRGNLRGLDTSSISVITNHTLALHWTDDSGQAMANATDVLLLVLYLPTLNVFEVFKTEATRQEGNANISYSEYYMGLEAQCWASFGTALGNQYAVSTYLGVLVL